MPKKKKSFSATRRKRLPAVRIPSIILPPRWDEGEYCDYNYDPFEDFEFNLNAIDIQDLDLEEFLLEGGNPARWYAHLPPQFIEGLLKPHPGETKRAYWGRLIEADPARAKSMLLLTHIRGDWKDEHLQFPRHIQQEIYRQIQYPGTKPTRFPPRPSNEPYVPVVPDDHPLPPGMSDPHTWTCYRDVLAEYTLRRLGIAEEKFPTGFALFTEKIRTGWLSFSQRRADHFAEVDTLIRDEDSAKQKTRAGSGGAEAPAPAPYAYDFTTNSAILPTSSSSPQHGADHDTFPYFHDPPTERFHRRPALTSLHIKTTNHQGNTPLRRAHLDRFPSPSLYATTSLTDLTVVSPAKFTHVRCPVSSCHALHTDSLVLSIAGLALPVPPAPFLNYTSAGAVHLGPSNPHNVAFSIPHDHDDRHTPEQAQLRAAMSAVRLAAGCCRDADHGHLGDAPPQHVHHVVIKTDSVYLVEALLGSADGARGPMLLDWLAGDFKGRYPGEEDLWTRDGMAVLWAHFLYEMKWLWHYVGAQVDFWLVDPAENLPAVRLAETRLRSTWTELEPPIDDGEDFESSYHTLRQYAHHWYIPTRAWYGVLEKTTSPASTAWRRDIINDLTAKKE